MLLMGVLHMAECACVLQGFVSAAELDELEEMASWNQLQAFLLEIEEEEEQLRQCAPSLTTKQPTLCWGAAWVTAWVHRSGLQDISSAADLS